MYESVKTSCVQVGSSPRPFACTFEWSEKLAGTEGRMSGATWEGDVEALSSQRRKFGSPGLRRDCTQRRQGGMLDNQLSELMAEQPVPSSFG